MVYHEPVMLEETIQGLKIRPGGVYVDATFGGGGHSSAILRHLTNGKLIAFDQDEDAVKNIINDERFLFIRGNYRFLKNFLLYHGIDQIDGILADLGISSHHIDDPERGFSFRQEGPLDMRMNNRSTVTAKNILQSYPVEKLQDILVRYGEFSRNEARKIVSEIGNNEIETTTDIVKAVNKIAPRNLENKFLARIFQALRIEVNQELESLRKFLTQTTDLLLPGGRLVVITYHSLEDKLVKNFMKSGKFEGEAEKDFFGNLKTPLKPVNRSVIVASADEIKKNNRARSAKLRIAEKIQN